MKSGNLNFLEPSGALQACNGTALPVLLLLLLLLLLQLSFHSVAVVSTLEQTKQIRINIHRRNNKKHSSKIQNKVNTSRHITKTPTQLSKHPHIHTSTHYETKSFDPCLDTVSLMKEQIVVGHRYTFLKEEIKSFTDP
jgi:hypothetical protein